MNSKRSKVSVNKSNNADIPECYADNDYQENMQSKTSHYTSQYTDTKPVTPQPEANRFIPMAPADKYFQDNTEST